MILFNDFITKLFKFTITSGIGWLMSLTILYIGIRIGISPFWANVVGDTVAITYVFFTSAKKTFNHNHHFLGCKFIAYAIYQAIIIYLISFSILKISSNHIFCGYISSIQLNPGVIAKILITPFSLGLNFIFAYFVIEKIQIPQKSGN